MVATLDETLANARERLLAERNAGGHWEGELSSSALSTATALFALSLHDRERHADLVRGGIRWLVEHQNEDGGWGDTVLSLSNISTTALCWAALSVAGEEAAESMRRVEAWLTRAAGSLEPAVLAKTIADRYGKDRTFSVPILTMCALAGRLGKGREGWRHVPPLPFELAAFPRQWFSWMRLPVVSYALPALIAIGQVGHTHRPTSNPLARCLRAGTREPTLRILREIQPEGGGFLEATPLTSFVTMSLLGCGYRDHPVVREGVDFLIRSARPDGSWAIDTNLSTWLTTLAVNALAPLGLDQSLSVAEQRAVRDWLLGQQYREVHPYTLSQPGAWAWTDLPGGVPDADDTPGALLALSHLDAGDPEVRRAAGAGVTWLLDLQNRDGGIPTFCRGWGALPFDRSGADLTSHTVQAWNAWRPHLSPGLATRIDHGLREAARYLAREQSPEGAWLPLWFGNQHTADEANPTYGTARVLPAVLAVPEGTSLAPTAVQWLLRAQNADGGWGGGPGVPSSIEETAVAVQALAQALPRDASVRPNLERGISRLAELTEGGRRFDASPIGFYFARLWYFERLYPLIFTVGALSHARRALGQSPDGRAQLPNTTPA